MRPSVQVILDGLVNEKHLLENHISNLTSSECEDLMLFEQLTAISDAESAVRRSIKIANEALHNHPALFFDKTPAVLSI